MYLRLDGVEIRASERDTWIDLLQRRPQGVADALGVSVRGSTFSLIERVQEYAYAHVLTYADEEGRRIYERSLIMLFLAAVARVCPGNEVRIEHSYGLGIYAAFREKPDCQKLEAEMRRMSCACLPITRKVVPLDEAVRYFAQTGQQERLDVLRYREINHYTLYNLDGYEDYFYGRMAPHTGITDVFSLVPCGEGVVLMMPDKADPSHPAAFCDRPKLMATYSETANWYHILNCRNAADLNAMIDNHSLREFIRVCEALQEKRVQTIADQFIASGARIMLIAGPSSSGKTTFAHRLSIALRVHGLRPVKLSLDDYYLDRDSLPIEADGKPDLECIEALDLPLLQEHLPALLRGEEVPVPNYDFYTGKRTEQAHMLRVAEGQPIIIEGIHGLNERLTASVPRDMKFKIYISALTMLNLDEHNRIRTTDARLLRRIVRDSLFRGTPPEETMAMWDSVRRGEENYIFPFQEEADAMFNSSLPYELTLMRKYAYPSLLAVQRESPHFTLARRLVKFLRYIHPCDVEDEVPVNSILREFIGGCCFYREDD